MPGRDGYAVNRLGQSTESDHLKWSIETFATASRQLLQLLVTRTNSTEFVCIHSKQMHKCNVQLHRAAKIHLNAHNECTHIIIRSRQKIEWRKEQQTEQKDEQETIETMSKSFVALLHTIRYWIVALDKSAKHISFILAHRLFPPFGVCVRARTFYSDSLLLLLLYFFLLMLLILFSSCASSFCCLCYGCSSTQIFNLFLCNIAMFACVLLWLFAFVAPFLFDIGLSIE